MASIASRSPSSGSSAIEPHEVAARAELGREIQIAAPPRIGQQRRHPARDFAEFAEIHQRPDVACSERWSSPRSRRRTDRAGSTATARTTSAPVSIARSAVAVTLSASSSMAIGLRRTDLLRERRRHVRRTGRALLLNGQSALLAADSSAMPRAMRDGSPASSARCRCWAMKSEALTTSTSAEPGRRRPAGIEPQEHRRGRPRTRGAIRISGRATAAARVATTAGPRRGAGWRRSSGRRSLSTLPSRSSP